ncbi:glucosaminidase domain-containing protein [Marinobacter sp. SS21]|uniref:glucosaminidase domain-containing protein n=1 Tax=Marinobacter sp. SS21 TaxID=2979460 RepID=UPI00232B3388|nr:glucosaminidase domain-containing protein [Marinobacter sp. SS21]MDC0661771.1 glucosaminidase domain-containing protein [Marinobacter sp. SS21]
MLVVRALLLLVPLIGFAFWGSLYTPPPYQAEGPGAQPTGKLPPLPRWSQAPLPEFSSYHDTIEKKAAFFAYLYPRIVLANSRVLIARQYLLKLSQQDTLRPSELTWLKQQGDRLRVTAPAGSAESFAALRLRLDAIPPSLVMAQAANESAWGTSRFAREGNNLFGQWCFATGCGLVPQRRGEDQSHEVARFASPYHSISAYIQNLNRHRSYRHLRHIRAQARQAGQRPDGLSMAAGLSQYSERGDAYVQEIQGMIRFNNLGYFDQQFAVLLTPSSEHTLKHIAVADEERSLVPDRATLVQSSPENEG